MKWTARLALLAGTAALGAQCLAYATLIDGFGSFAAGPLSGQKGWEATHIGQGSEQPEIVDWNGRRAARLKVGDAFGDESTLFRRFDNGLDLVSGGYRQVRTTFMIYRPRPASGRFAQNLYWWLLGDNPDYGMQWDVENPETSMTIPVGAFANSSMIETLFDVWTELAYEYDFDARRYSSWYGGTQVDFDAPMDQATVDAYREMNGFLISLRHRSASGTGPDTAYIADLRVEAVPEPSIAAVLALGLAALARRRRG